MLRFSSISANTGLAPHSTIAFTVIIQDKGEVITSSPSFIPAALRLRYKALLPDDKQTTCLTFKKSERFFSNF